jgi:hypothetical protein
VPRVAEATHDRGVTIALALYSLALVGWLLLGGVRVTGEAGLYYFKIAQNVAYGAGSTFDGLHVTNGYQPLWVLCLVPLFWISSNPGTALTLGVILQGILMAAAGCILYRTARTVSGRLGSSLAVILWLALTYREALSGLEFGVHALVVLSAAYVYGRWSRVEPPRRSTCLLLGVLMSLTFLARLENILLAGLVGLSLARREIRGGLKAMGLRRLVAYALPVAAAGIAYVAVNLWLCGHALPVSAALKRDWSLYKLSLDPYYQSGGWWLAKAHQLLWPLRTLPGRYPLYLTLGGFGAGLLYLFGLRSLRPWGPFVLFSVFQVLAYATLFHGEFSFVGASPYYVIQPWATALLVGAAADNLLSRWRGRMARWAIAGVALGLALLTFGSVQRWRDRERRGLSMRPDYDTGRWAQAHLAADTTIGTWRTGAFAYLTGFRVVDLSGLVNSWDYYRVERRDLCGYWEKAGITHLVDLFENGRPPMEEPDHAAYAACADRLERIWSDDRYGKPWRMEAYRIRPAKPAEP